MMDKMIEAITLWVIVAAASGSSMAELERLVSGEQLAGEKDLRHIDKITVHSAFSNNSGQQRWLVDCAHRLWICSCST